MVNYVWQDVFFYFRQFFLTQETAMTGFLYDLSFGFMPRRFNPKEIIYEEEDEVPEMYFIMEGNVGVGFRKQAPNHESEEINLYRYFNDKTFICDYYVCFGKRAEFSFQALKPTKTYALQRKFMLEVFAKYPEYSSLIKQQSRERYLDSTKRELEKTRANVIADMNLKSSYRVLKVEMKKQETLVGDQSCNEEATLRLDQLDQLGIHEELRDRMKEVKTAVSSMNEDTERFRQEYDIEVKKLQRNLEILRQPAL